MMSYVRGLCSYTEYEHKLFKATWLCHATSTLLCTCWPALALIPHKIRTGRDGRLHIRCARVGHGSAVRDDATDPFLPLVALWFIEQIRSWCRSFGHILRGVSITNSSDWIMLHFSESWQSFNDFTCGFCVSRRNIGCIGQREWPRMSAISFARKQDKCQWFDDGVIRSANPLYSSYIIPDTTLMRPNILVMRSKTVSIASQLRYSWSLPLSCSAPCWEPTFVTRCPD